MRSGLLPKVWICLSEVLPDLLGVADEGRDVLDGEGPGDLQAGVAHLQPDGEPPHEEDGHGEHEEGHGHVDPQDDGVLGEGDISDICLILGFCPQIGHWGQSVREAIRSHNKSA